MNYRVSTLVSDAPCKSKGRVYCHSKEEGRWGDLITPRWDLNASHNKKMNKIRPVNEIIEPIDDTTFHLVIASG